MLQRFEASGFSSFSFKKSQIYFSVNVRIQWDDEKLYYKINTTYLFDLHQKIFLIIQLALSSKITTIIYH